MDTGLFTHDPPLVGRREEMSRLLRLLDPGGAAPALVLSGNGGVGKSRLVRAVADEAARRGWAVAWGQAYPVERGIAYALFADAFLPVLRELDADTVRSLSRGGEEELARLFPVLRSGAAHASPEWTDPEEFKTRLYWAFTEFLRGYAARSPLLVVLDDLQWASDSSLELLHFAARHLPQAQVRFLCVYNAELAGESPGMRETEASLLARGLAERVVLPPLDSPETRALVQELFRVDGTVCRELADRLHDWTQGNLLFLLEALKALVETGRLHRRDGVWLGWETETPELPGSVREAVLGRMRRRSPDAQAAADAACVFGAPVAHPVLARVAGLPDARFLDAVEELVRQGVLGEEPREGAVVYDFRHPMFREGLYAELGLVRARTLHARAVEALESEETGVPAASAGALAYHLLRAGPGATPRKALACLLEAGRDALVRHADGEAAQYLEAALELAEAEAPGDGPTVVEVLGLLAQARARQGGFDQALALWERALAAGPPSAAGIAEARRRMGLASYWAGRHGDALDHFQAGLQALGEAAGETIPRAGLHLARGVCLQAMGRPEAALDEVHSALAMAESVGDVATLARAHRVLALLHMWTGPPAVARSHAHTAIEHAEACGELGVAFWSHWALAALEGLTGHTGRMEREIEEAEKVAERLRSPVLRVWTAELILERAYATGEWETGIAFGERAVAVARTLNQRQLLPRLLVWTALIHLGKGEMERGLEMVDEAWSLAGLGGPEGDGEPDVHTAIPAYIGRAAHHHALAEWAETLRWAEAGLELADRSGYVIWSIHHILPLVAEALIQTRDLAGAERVGGRLRADSERMGHALGLAWADACDALVVWLRGDLKGGVERLRKAAEALEAIPMIPDAARVRRQLAGRLADLGDREGALVELRTVHETFVRLGNRRELEKARRLFQGLDTRPPPLSPAEGTGLLTGRETQVARMVAEGASNKSIARALGIAPRTVTTHLANAFKKLEVTSRHELGERVRTGRIREV